MFFNCVLGIIQIFALIVADAGRVSDTTFVKTALAVVNGSTHTWDCNPAPTVA